MLPASFNPKASYFDLKKLGIWEIVIAFMEHNKFIIYDMPNNGILSIQKPNKNIPHVLTPIWSYKSLSWAVPTQNAHGCGAPAGSVWRDQISELTINESI